MQPAHDAISDLVYSATGMEVSTTICDGKILYTNGKFLTLNEKEIYSKASKWQKKIAAALQKIK